MTNAVEPVRASSHGNLIVSANVRAELAYAGLHQGDLASALGLSDMAMSRRLSEKYNAEFSASEIVEMADFFGIDPGDLFKERERRAGAGAIGRRTLYLLDGVGPAGIEPTTSTVKSRRID